ncbi:hypothetical protein L2W58_07920 [Dethiosulfovibrio sp. F2B]|uniref:hypothetical protein n=1 Tax=Dethiosulfovibrio faecalis TaxID=2720018 RepID=UPI001F22F0CD|nr:hypothetical protein [Dethiosulfovibrio faecalis]MCF4151729.1 hypothetical protein [Dethiosulfovibrio faecalis]
MNMRKIVTLVIVFLIIGGTLHFKGLKGTETPAVAENKASKSYPILLDLSAPG